MASFVLGFRGWRTLTALSSRRANPFLLTSPGQTSPISHGLFQAPTWPQHPSWAHVPSTQGADTYLPPLAWLTLRRKSLQPQRICHIQHSSHLSSKSQQLPVPWTTPHPCFPTRVQTLSLGNKPSAEMAQQDPGTRCPTGPPQGRRGAGVREAVPGHSPKPASWDEREDGGTVPPTVGLTTAGDPGPRSMRLSSVTSLSTCRAGGGLSPGPRAGPRGESWQAPPRVPGGLL